MIASSTIKIINPTKKLHNNKNSLILFHHLQTIENHFPKFSKIGLTINPTNLQKFLNTLKNVFQTIIIHKRITIIIKKNISLFMMTIQSAINHLTIITTLTPYHLYSPCLNTQSQNKEYFYTLPTLLT